MTLGEGPLNSRSPERTAWPLAEAHSAGLYTPGCPGSTTAGSPQWSPRGTGCQASSLPGDALRLLLPSPSTTRTKVTKAPQEGKLYRLTARAPNEAVKGLRANCMDVGAAMGLWAAQPPSPAPAATPAQGAQACGGWSPRDPASALSGPVLFWPGAEEEGDALGLLEDHEFSFTLLEAPEKGCRQGRGIQMLQILQQMHSFMHTLLFFFFCLLVAAYGN